MATSIPLDDTFEMAPVKAKKPEAGVALDDSFSVEPLDDSFTEAPAEPKEAVFWDNKTPLTPMAKEDEAEYLRMVNDRNVRPEDISAFTAAKGFQVRPEDIAKSRAEFDEYNKKTGRNAGIGIQYDEAPVNVNKEELSGSAMEAGARGFGEGALAGFLDEAGAVVDTLGGTEGRENVFNSDKRWADLWYDNQRKNSAILQNDDENYFKSQLAGNIAGGLVLPFGARAKTVGELAAVGGAYGAAEGFGGTDGSFTERAKGAAIGAPVGAAAGAVLGKGIQGAGKLYQKVMGKNGEELAEEVADFNPNKWIESDDGTYVADFDGYRVRVKPKVTPAAAEEIAPAVTRVVDKANEIAGKWKNAPEIEVVNTVDEIPDEVIRKAVQSESPDAYGFLGRDGKVRLIASNIEKDNVDIDSVLYHEALGHYGLAQKFGEDLQDTLRKMYDEGNDRFRSEVDEWVQKNSDAYVNAPDRQEIAIEEVLAEIAQDGGAKLSPKIMDKVTNVVKGYARQIGMDLKYSDREIKTIMGMAEDAVIKGKPSAADNGFRFMRPSQRREQDFVETAGDRPMAPDEALRALEEGYTPTERSWAEANREAAKRGIRPSEIKSMGTPEALDKKLFQLDQLARRLDERIGVLNEKFDSPDWSVRDKDEYKKLIYEQQLLFAQAFDRQAEVGRALNALKAIKFTKNRVGSLKDAPPEEALDDPEVFERFVRAMQAQQGNPAGMQQLAVTVHKPYWWQYALSFRHAAMLSGLGTHAKNATDNAFMIARELEETMMALPGGIIRKGINAVGLHADDGVTPAEAGARMYGLLRAAGDIRSILSESAKSFGPNAPRQINSKVSLADARIPGIGVVSDALQASDTFFRSFHNAANLHVLGVREAQAKGLKGLAAFQDGSNRATAPSIKMVKEAEAMADTSLFVDRPFFNAIESWKNVRPGMSGEEQVKALAANVVFPFFRVSDRMLFEKLRRSPLSVLDKVTREDFKAGGARRDIAISRTLFGSALVAYYWHEAGEGNVTGDMPDYQKKAALEAGGYMTNAENQGDKYVDGSGLGHSFSWSDLQNSMATSIASIRAAYDRGDADDTDTATALGSATRALFSVLSSNSFAENITQYTEPFKSSGREEEADRKAANLVGSMAAQFVPAIVRNLNTTYMDTTKRDTQGDKTFGDIVYGRVVAGLPYASQTLNPKLSVYGQEQDQGKTLLGMYNYQDVKDEPSIKEIQRLERLQKEPLVTRAPAKFTRNGEKVELKGTEYLQYQRIVGALFLEGMAAVTELPAWESIDDETKKAAVKELLKEARDGAKNQLYPETEEEDLDLDGFEEDE